MALLRLRGVSLGYGGPTLLDNIDLTLHEGQRTCLIGRNGAGKSTLMKLIAGEIKADHGEMEIRQGVRVTRLQQEVPQDMSGSVFDIVAGGLGDVGHLLAEFHKASHDLAEDPSEANMTHFERVQNRLESNNGWELNQRVDSVISRLDLNADTDFLTLSGGWKRRVLLAQALVQEPDLLLLDEPTNHLDVEAITWMEEFLLSFKGALLFITHDRSFLQNLATRIIDLDRGSLSSWDCDYHTYLERKEAFLEAQAHQQAEFDKKLAQEEAWIRQGIKARRTRNEGRVRALQALRKERSQRRDKAGKVKLDVQAAERSGKLVIEAEHISYQWQDRALIKDFDLTLMRGDKLGIIGPNGCGKTTLLKIILGQLDPQSGTVKLGTKLQIAYFDQYRAQLDETRTVRDEVSGGSDNITINGQSKHVMSYLADFLFAPDRANQPVSALSGGERNRLLLARLFTQPANMLVLDEPTNDLDLETLELLEERLIDFPGTVILVSHDRAFLDNVVTSSVIFEGNGRVDEYIGGYSDYLGQRPDPADSTTPSKPATKAEKPASPTPEAPKPEPKKKKLSYKDQRELDALPGKIEALETELEDLQTTMSDPAFFQKDHGLVKQTTDRLAEAEAELEVCFARWEELDG